MRCEARAKLGSFAWTWCSLPPHGRDVDHVGETRGDDRTVVSVKWSEPSDEEASPFEAWVARVEGQRDGYGIRREQPTLRDIADEMAAFIETVAGDDEEYANPNHAHAPETDRRECDECRAVARVQSARDLARRYATAREERWTSVTTETVERMRAALAASGEERPPAVALPDAGPERDALLAPLLGYRVDDDGVWWAPRRDGKQSNGTHDPPSISTDRAPALALFEQIVEYVGVGSVSSDMEDLASVWATFWRADGEGEVSYCGDDFQDAVSGAALLALGICYVDDLSDEPRTMESVDELRDESMSGGRDGSLR